MTKGVVATALARGWSVYCRDGQWILSFKDERARGKKKWKEHRIPREIARTEKQAERYSTAWLSEYRAQLGDRPAALVEVVEDVKPTIRSLADDWIDLRDGDPKLSPAIRQQNASNLRQHVLRYPEIADVPICDLGSGVLREWLRKVRDHGKLKKVVVKTPDGGDRTKPGRGGKWVATGEPLAAYSTRNVVNSLTAFFDDAMAEEWIDIPANPMRHPGVRKEIPDAVTRAGRRVIVHLSKPVAEKLLASPTTSEIRRTRYLVALTSGMRDGEIAALRWDDVDLEARTLAVTKNLATKGPEGWATLGKTKTDASVRTLPLHPLAARALKAWKATGWARHVGQHPKTTDAVFANAAGDFHRPDSAGFLRDDLDAAELPSKYLDKHPFDFHALRRSFYSWLRAEGAERDIIEMLMGHSGSTVGDRHYDARDLERMRKAVEMIKLDLSTASVIAFPMRAAGGGQPPQEAECHPAKLPAGRGKPAGSSEKILKDLRHARSDSNRRHSASKADALSS